MAEETAKSPLVVLAVGGAPGWADQVEKALGPFGSTVLHVRSADDALAAVRGRALHLAVIDGDEAGGIPARLADAAPGLLVVVAAGGTVVGAAGRVREAVRSALVRVANQLAHDLNNPLGGLKLYVRLLERSLAQGKTDEATEIAGKIGRAVDQLADILIEIRRYDLLPASERAGTRLEAVLEDCLRFATPEDVGRGGGT